VSQGHDGWVDEVLRFWFVENPKEAWFKKDDGFDRAIADKFGDLHRRLSETCDVDAAVESPERALATIIVLDQFSRNLHRDSALAFAADGVALTVARRAVARGFDLRFPAEGRVFFYLPFEHSEKLADQRQSVALISALGVADSTWYAERHREIIERFGRFPHRNAVLGRVSTAEEKAFLEEPHSSF